MRDDMAQVIVERPRLRGGSTRKGRTGDWDAMPSREGMRRPHVLRGDPKPLNENLSPLRRFLERQVGRPWDKVYWRLPCACASTVPFSSMSATTFTISSPSSHGV